MEAKDYLKDTHRGSTRQSTKAAKEQRSLACPKSAKEAWAPRSSQADTMYPCAQTTSRGDGTRVPVVVVERVRTVADILADTNKILNSEDEESPPNVRTESGPEEGNTDVEVVNSLDESEREISDEDQDVLIRLSPSDSMIRGADGNLYEAGPDKKRGRPITTGVWEQKKAAMARKEREEEERRLEMLVNPSAPAKLSKKRKVRKLERLEELKMAPTKDLPNRILEAVKVVDKVRATAGKLKGGDQSGLLDAAATITAAVTQWVCRMEREEGYGRDVELEELRSEIAALKEDNARLKSRVDRALSPQRGEAMDVDELPVDDRCPASPAIGTRTRRLLQPRLIVEYSSEEEDSEADRARREKEAAEIRRLQILEDIRDQGMPEVRRPTLGGKSALMEAAVPPRHRAGATRPAREPVEQSAENRVLSAILERMERLEMALGKRTAGPAAKLGLATQTVRENAQPASKSAKRASRKKEVEKERGKRSQQGRVEGKAKPKPSYAAALKSAATGSGPGVQGTKPHPPATRTVASKAAPPQPPLSPRTPPSTNGRR